MSGFATGYTRSENAKAMDALLKGIRRCECPECKVGMLTYEPPYPAEEDTGTGAWNGGVSCDCCDYMLEDAPLDDMEAA